MYVKQIELRYSQTSEDSYSVVIQISRLNERDPHVEIWGTNPASVLENQNVRVTFEQLQVINDLIRIMIPDWNIMEVK